jgi:hypothetical protein
MLGADGNDAAAEVVQPPLADAGAAIHFALQPVPAADRCDALAVTRKRGQCTRSPALGAR